MDAKSISDGWSSPSLSEIEEWKKPRRDWRNTSFIDVSVPTYQLELPPVFAYDRRASTWKSVREDAHSRFSTYSTGTFESGSQDDADEKDGAAASAGDFPRGFILAMIVLAVILSFFLVSLDMVSYCSHPPRPEPPRRMTVGTWGGTDDRHQCA